MTERLPIEDALPELRRALAAAPNAVLTAPPGAGKTTLVPLALLDEAWARGGRIVMLEPRRIAARGAARRMAQLLGERVGETVGYVTRGDTKIGPRTRIEVVTEGILTRRLQRDPGLEGVAAVLFDEFHERSLHADLGLALTLQAQALFRDDLRLLVMSATIEADAVAALLGGAAIVRSAGRMFPVETRYADRRSDAPVERRTAAAVVDALRRHPEGDTLVFLPGGAEIRRTAQELSRLGLPSGVRVAPLYGAMPPEAQDAAVAPSPPGERKVVLATSIAETSLTVEGVRIVVDAGLSRVPRYSPRTGLTALETVPVTAASADQRRGRAGRVAPGVCYRLWTEEEHRRLAPFGEPDIAAADLTPLALELAVWGAADPMELAFLDPPPEGAYKQATDLLRRLGAIDERGAATAAGRRMAELAMHPRLAHMTLRAVELGRGDLACELAALLEEREETGASVDMRERVEALRRGASPAAARQREEAARRMRDAGITRAGTDAAYAGELLALAFPDRIALRRANGKYTLANGRGAEFAGDTPLSREPLLAIAELDGAGVDSRIRSAAPLQLDALKRLLPDRLRTEDDVYWDDASASVRARRRIAFDALVLEETPLASPDPDRVRAALLAGVASTGLSALPWTRAAEQWRDRVRFLRRHAGDEWPDLSDEALLEALDDWLGPHVYGMKSKGDLQKLKLVDVLESMLTWDQRRKLDEWAPTHLVVPSGSRHAVDYGDPDAPSLSAKLQELFGWAETPRIAGGRVPLTIELLSPAQRPVQITRDLANFWRETYFEIKKDLKGRYPKHYWPDDPTAAVATRGTKPRPAPAP
ncbi:ATP-dependent helicase HrpB [Paenibacillus sp.]|uniref:ATP-dependent helicase HrpB n=1 Tax=Paenibacillus sp. TaxID=58172 RepID=UPI002D4EB46B|nr:ATP-dependent helicase HrpB [Paenibacillus sp.]HZG86807.1 ATP-dependent helicase HrpB [Paenibacillus sp.]